MSRPKLRKLVREQMATRPDMTTDQLMVALSPLYHFSDHKWLWKTLVQYRWSIIRMARIKAYIFNNDIEPTDR